MARLRLRTLVACGKTVVSTWGDIDVSTSALLRARLSALAAPGCRLVLNLSHTRYLDGTGLTALAQVHQALRVAGGELILVRCQPPVARILRLSGFHRLFAIEERHRRSARSAGVRMTAFSGPPPA